MSFSGSLSEFDISNIFLLIEQDSATGELIVVTTDNRYVISFKNGQVVNARSESESIRRFLFIYLKQVKNYSGMEIKELDTAFHNNNRLLSDELLKKGYLDQKEMAIIVQSGIIDITSIVFSVKKGNYIFDTKPNMEADQFLTLAIPANFVLLESARKSDEESTLGSIVTEDTIFDSHISISPEQVHDPVSNFALYAVAHVNGARTVSEICTSVFFSSCHVYTALNDAYKAGKIVLVNTPDSSLKPLRQKAERQNSDTSDIVVSSAITGIIALVMFIIGLVLLRGNIWKSKIENRTIAVNQIESSSVDIKLRNAQLLYQGLHNEFPMSYRQLRDAKMLTEKEINLMRNMGKEPTKK